MQIKTLLKRAAITVAEETPVATAWEVMRRHGVRHLPVLRGAALVGMLTERDVVGSGPSSVDAIRAHDLSSLKRSLTVAEVMTREPLAVPLDTSVAEAARLARARRVDGLVVTDGGEVAGVVTRADLLAVLRGVVQHRYPAGLGHVLVGTSLRPGRGNALDEAVRLAVAADAALTTVHVLSRTSWLSGVDGASADDVVWVQRARRRIVDDVAAAMSGIGRIARVACEVADGDVARALAGRAGELDADVIVVGRPASRGPFGARGATVADRLLPLAPCPVIVVPAGRRGRRGEAGA